MPQPVENLLEQLHSAFPELEESVELELDEGLASSIGRGIGNIGRGVQAIGRGIGSAATNFAAGVTGISDEMITSLIQAFENPASATVSRPVTAAASTEKPQEGGQLDVKNIEDTKNYFHDIVEKLLDLIDDGVAAPEIREALLQIVQAEKANSLDYSKWQWGNLDKLNNLAKRVFPDWRGRELPPDAKDDITETPLDDAKKVAGAA